MADLSTLDSALPGATEALTNGDDRIRETRDAVKSSFGGADAGSGTAASEHYLKGFHKFPAGSTGARPAAGNGNRLYLNTTEKRIERDNGSAWTLLNVVPLGASDCAGSISATTTPTDVPGLSVTIDVPTGARVMIQGAVRFSATGTPDAQVGLVQNGVTLITQAERVAGNAGSGQVVWVRRVLTAPATGSVTYKLQASVAAIVGLTIAGQIGIDQLVVQVL